MPATYEFWCPGCHVKVIRYRNARVCEYCGVAIERLPYTPTRLEVAGMLDDAITKAERRFGNNSSVVLNVDVARAALALIEPAEVSHG